MSQNDLMTNDAGHRFSRDSSYYETNELSTSDNDLVETPTKKNKRKLSEPKKRMSDFSIKRFCPDSPVGSVADSETSDDRERVHEQSSPVKNTEGSNSESSYVSSIRTPLKVPSLPYSSTYKNHKNSMKSSINNNKETSLKPLHLGEINTDDCLAARILNTKNSTFSSAPMQRFGHYPSEGLRGSDPYDFSNMSKKQRKNYKNMTRARRVEANARERSRVHTISAAFEALRRAVPSYSYNQKLSKLAILRIASTYILSLARLADMDAGHSTAPDSLTFSECVDLCTRTIQTEGRARRRH